MMAAPKLRGYGLATVACALALALAWPLDAPASCFLLAVAVSALYGGKGPSLLPLASPPWPSITFSPAAIPTVPPTPYAVHRINGSR
jgi:hypothetical protein